jgi:hypothetical protein
MSDEATNLPTTWEGELAKHAVAAAQAERPMLGFISLKAGVMTYEGQAIPGNKLNCIVVGSIQERTFYEERYDPNNTATPVCFAFHLGIDNVPWIPDNHSPKKQHAECVTCPRNAWGSDLNGRKGKACKEKRKLVVIPQSGNSKEMAIISVPVTSVRNWSNYVNGVAASAKRPPWGVVTEISVAPHATKQIEVKFSPVEVLPDDKLQEVFDKIPMAMAVLSQPYEAQPEPAAEPEDAKPKKKAKY